MIPGFVHDLPAVVERQLSEWRKQNSIYGIKVDVDDGSEWAIFRALTKHEADLLELEHDEVEQDERLLRLSLIWPEMEVLEEWPAGSVDHVLKSMVHISGWGIGGFADAMEEATVYANSLHGAMAAFVCSAFSGYMLADIDKMTARELARHVRAAESIHGQSFDFERWLDPEGWSRKNRKRMHKVKGGRIRQHEVPKGANADVQAVAEAEAEASRYDILSDPTAVRLDKQDPNMIRRLIKEQREGMRG